MPTDIYTLGIKADTTDIRKADADLDALAKSASGTEQSVKRFTGSVGQLGTTLKQVSAGTVNLEKTAGKLGNSMSKLGGAFRLQKGSAQQLGYQLQDVAVQAQMGVSAFTILGQQGSQLAMVLGPQGALIGAAIAIGAALGGVMHKAITGTGKDLDDLVERIGNATDGFREMASVQRMAVAQDRELGRLQAIAAMEALKEKVDAAKEGLETLNNTFFYFTRSDNQKGIDLTSKQIERQSAEVVRLAAEYKTASEEMNGFNDLTKEMLSGEGVGPSKTNEPNRAEREGALLNALFSEQQGFREEQQAAESALLNALLQEKIDFAAAEREMDEKQRVSDRTWLAEKRNQRENALAGELQAIADFYGNVEELRHADNMANGNALQEQLNQRREVGNGERQGLKEFDRKTAEDNKKAENDKLDVKRRTSGAISELMNSQSKELFNTAKAASMAETIMNTYTGMSKAVAQGGIFGFGAAGLIAAAGASQVANIASTSFGDSSVKGSNMPTEAPTNITNNTQSSATTINISGGVGFGVDELTALFDSDAVIINKDSAQGRALR